MNNIPGIASLMASAAAGGAAVWFATRYGQKITDRLVSSFGPAESACPPAKREDSKQEESHESQTLVIPGGDIPEVDGAEGRLVVKNSISDANPVLINIDKPISLPRPIPVTTVERPEAIEQSGSGVHANTHSCVVCGKDKKLKKCSKCQNAFYCSPEHQRQDWPKHKSICKKATQMGLYCNGQSTMLTPVLLPLSTGNIDSLRPDSFSAILHCYADFVGIRVSPISTLLNQEDHVICVFNAGMFYKRYTEDLAINPKLKLMGCGEGELCYHLVNMTADLHDGFGHQISGEALFFFLQPGRDFSIDHFDAITETRVHWFAEDNVTKNLPTTKAIFYKTIEKLSKRFSGSSRVLSTRKVKALWLPAIGEAKVSLVNITVELRESDEEYYTATFETIQRKPWLGDTGLEQRFMELPQGSLEGKGGYKIFWNEKFMIDGSPINQTLIHGTKGKLHHKWAGNILAAKTTARDYFDESGRYVDASMDEIKSIFGFFSKYGA